MTVQEYAKRGYLNESFRLFHIRDHSPGEMEFHYHEFDKLVFFLSGAASYVVEGRRYLLQPWDVLLVSHHLIHKPEVDTSRLYDRVVLYVDPDYMAAHSGPDGSLEDCFRTARERDFCLLRPGAALPGIKLLLKKLEAAGEGYAGSLLSEALFWELLVTLQRAMLEDKTYADAGVSIADPKIAQMLAYINENLSADLSVERLSKSIYMSKYHFMRRFREATGATVHSYITQKRLLCAADAIRGGMSAAEAARRSGFRDYSTFHRAFKRQFDVCPRDLPAAAP